MGYVGFVSFGLLHDPVYFLVDVSTNNFSFSRLQLSIRQKEKHRIKMANSTSGVLFD